MEEIRNTINKFANSFDRKDWKGLRSVLSDEIHCDYSGLRGSIEVISSDAYVSKRTEALDHLQTHHIISNHQIEVEGDNANCIASTIIWRRSDSKEFNTHAMYTFELESQDGNWKILSIKQVVLWNEGNRSIHVGTNENS